MKRLTAVTLMVLLASVGSVALADSHAPEPSIYVWINAMKAKPGQGEALTAHILEEGTKTWDPLVQAGGALEWGIARPIVHNGNDPVSHYEWVSFVGWQGVDQFMARFMEMRQAMSPDEMKAAGETWASLVEPGSHADTINYSAHIGKNEVARPGYIHLSYWTARPGNPGAAMDLYKEYAVPVYDQLAADGAIQNYGMHVPAVATTDAWTHMGWYASEKLAARDAVWGAFKAKDAAMSEEEMKSLMDNAMATFEPGRVDQILLVVHHMTASGGGE